MPYIKLFLTFMASVLVHDGRVYAQAPASGDPGPQDNTRINEVSLNRAAEKPYVCGYGRIHLIGLGALGANRPAGQWGKLLITTEYMPNLRDHPEVYGETTYGAKVIQIGKSELKRDDFFLKMKALLAAAAVNTPVRITSEALDCNAERSDKFEVRLCAYGDETCLRGHF